MKKYILCLIFLFALFFLYAKENKDEALKFYLKGQRHLANGKYERALAFFTKTIEIDSTKACYWYGFTKAFYYSYKSEGDYVGIYYERAKTYYQRVISYYQKVITLSNDSGYCAIQSYLDLAELEFIKLNNYIAAMDYYKNAIRLYPTDFTIYKKRAELQEHLVTKSKEFGCVMSRLVINYRNDTITTNKLSYDEIAKNAIKDYEKSIELKNPDSANLYSKCGNVYLNLEEYEEAITYYTKSIEINPSYGFPYIFRAEAKRQLLDHIGACEDYKQACKLLDIKMSVSEREKYCK